LESISSSFLRSFLERASLRGEQPSAQIFEEKFRQSVSPARELLANVLKGMGSSLTGQKFLTVRQQAWEQYMADAEMKQRQQQLEQQKVAQMAQVAEGLYRQRQQQSAQQRIAAIKAAQTSEDRAFQAVKLMEELGIKREDLAQRLQIHKENLEQKNNEHKDPLFDTAYKQVRSEMTGNGIDPDDPANSEFLNREATRIANEMFATRQMLEEKYKKPKQPGMNLGQIAALYQLREGKNGWGENEFKSVNKLTGQYLNAKPWEENGAVADFSP
jgi:DNA-binding XRE family transcriptional regulator